KKDSEIQITQARQIVDVRNRIIHGYDTVSDEIIWAIVWQYIPVLQKEVSNLLEE
ncbi:toxin-antitoxin system, antitoxin component domain protein, partial [Capnocytophaga sp. oral taxon 329 str. F0087]